MRKLTVTLAPAIAAMLAVAACGASGEGARASSSSNASVTNDSYAMLTVAGQAGDGNIYDPSVEYDGETGWLAFSSVELAPGEGPPRVHTDIARSSDGGASWNHALRVNASAPASFTDGAGRLHKGAWRYEVPSIVHDPEDAAAPWKLFAHRYFASDSDERLFEFGWITMRTATSPQGPWSAEQAVLGARIAPVAPFAVAARVSDLDPALANIMVITEPGVLAHDGVLYMALSGVELGSNAVDRIFLIASDDHGASWRFVADLIDREDSEMLGADRHDGAALVEDQGSIYLLATPASGGVLHNGTDVFRFTDIASGALERDGRALRVVNHIDRQAGHQSEGGAGQADFDAGNTAGVLFPQRNDRAPEFFRIFSTGKDLLGQEMD